MDEKYTDLEICEMLLRRSLHADTKGDGRMILIHFLNELAKLNNNRRLKDDPARNPPRPGS